MRRPIAGPAALAALLSTAACAPALMKLPAASATPAPDAAAALAEATKACAGVNTISAELAARGSVGGNGLRGRLLIGLAKPASARIEAVAPFGAPIFIFTARDGDATLLLPRDNQVLQHGRPEDVLAAIAGVPLTPSALLAALTGCATASTTAAAHTAGADWRVIVEGPTTVYLRRDRSQAPWHVVAATHDDPGAGAWRAEYANEQNGLPRSVRLVSADGKRFDLRLDLSQVETNTTLGPDVFRVQVPPDAAPLTLPELQRAGPMRGSEPAPKKPSS